MSQPSLPPQRSGPSRDKVPGDWRALLREFGSEARSPLSVLSKVWDLLPVTGTPLGYLASTLERRGVSPAMQSPEERGADLLPLNPLVVDTLPDLDDDMKGALKLLLHTLNFLSMGVATTERLTSPSLQLSPPLKSSCWIIFLKG